MIVFNPLDTAGWNKQIVAADRAVLVDGNPLAAYDKSIKFTVKSGDQPGSTSGYRNEYYQGKNYGVYGTDPGMIPMGVEAYHVICFTPIKGNATTWGNFAQLHGAQSGAQPCAQWKGDSNDKFQFRVNGPGGTSRTWTLASKVPYGQPVTIIARLKPSLSGTGVVQMWMCIGTSGDFAEIIPATTGLSYGFQDTYPKLGMYGDSGGSNLPWEVIHHGAWYSVPTYEEALGYATLDSATPPPPPPPDLQAQLTAALNEIAALQSNLSTVTAQRDDALSVAMGLQSRIDSMRPLVNSLGTLVA